MLIFENSAFECPHCFVHLCQLCLTNFSTRRQKLANNAKSKASAPSTSTTGTVSSSKQEEGPSESSATSVDEDFPSNTGTKGSTGSTGNTGSTGKAENTGKAEKTGKKSEKRKKDRCTFPLCKRWGHTEDKCWKKFPDLRKKQSPNDSAPSSFASKDEKPGEKRSVPKAKWKPAKVNKVPEHSAASTEAIKSAHTEEEGNMVNNITSHMAETKLNAAAAEKPSLTQPQQPTNKPKKQQRSKGKRHKSAPANAQQAD